ncbi:MAG: TIR domain-containing protein [Anaerolineaceae bacterium]|nr:TIR domain-containing protein [Anaerolineaceae bacterium]
MPQIFISYSRQDARFATQLAEALSQSGLEVWIDLQDIHAGSRWSDSIQQGLDGSDAMVLIVSPGSMASENVSDEWQYFLDHKKPIVPVLHKPAKIHFQLNRIQYIDFASQTFETALEQLQDELSHKGVTNKKSNESQSERLRQPTQPKSPLTRYGLAGGLTFIIVLVLLLSARGIFTPANPATPATTTSTTLTAAPGGGTGNALPTLPAEVYTVTFPTEATFPIRVLPDFEFVNLRSGPGIEFEVIASAPGGQIFNALSQAQGFDAEGESIVWYQILHTVSGRKLWISSSVVEVENAEVATRRPPPTLPSGGGAD